MSNSLKTTANSINAKYSPAVLLRGFAVLGLLPHHLVSITLPVLVVFCGWLTVFTLIFQM